MTADGDLPESSPDELRCPRCGEAVDVAPESTGQLVRCPYCNTDFFASPDQSHLPVVDDLPDRSAMEAAERASTFDKLRIENYIALRMGAIRARSWWLIGVCMSLLLVLDMIGKTILYVLILHAWGINPSLRLVAASALLIFARSAMLRAAEFKREIDRSALVDPATPPDFSTLGNGSERWKNLENVR